MDAVENLTSCGQNNTVVLDISFFMHYDVKQFVLMFHQFVFLI